MDQKEQLRQLKKEAAKLRRSVLALKRTKASLKPSASLGAAYNAELSDLYAAASKDVALANVTLKWLQDHVKTALKAAKKSC